jgi:hypothetical protein
MFRVSWGRVVAIIVATALISGCAEFNQRGGVVAEVGDFVLFTAHTKSHRLFRAYLLAGALLAAARQGGHNDADKAAIEGNLKTALLVAKEAYDCLYPDLTAVNPAAPKPAANPAAPGPAAKNAIIGQSAATTKENAVASIGTSLAMLYTQPRICQFFDEKMARLDYALFRLALSSIFNAQSNVYLGEIRDKLIGKIPVLSSTAKAAIYANKAVNETTTIVDDLLNLSFSSAGPVVTLLPLYRDSLELNMWLIIDNLTQLCGTGVPVTPAEPTYDISKEKVCKTLGYALAIMKDGNGNLHDWRVFVRQMNYADLHFEAYTPHFFLVTLLMYQSCISLFNDTSPFNKCQKMLTDSLSHEIAFQQSFIPGLGKRIYTSRRSPSQFARQPVPGSPADAAAAPKITATPPRPDSTGSIDQARVPVASAPSIRQ